MDYSKERAEIDLLISKGFEVRTPIKSIFKFGKKERIWRVKFLPLALMDLQTDLFFQLMINEENLYNENANTRNDEMMNAVKNNALICAEIVAISVLGSKLKIKLFRKILAKHFYWRIHSKDLFDFTMKLFKMNDFQNFTTSIILLKAKRTTIPLMEMEIPTATKAEVIELNQPTD